MKLYSYWRSSSAWRVRLVLELKEQSYEYVAVNLAPEASEQRSATYTAINAQGHVPTLEWSDGERTIRLGQSVAIVEYLEEHIPQPALLPHDPVARAFVRQAVEVVNSGIQPLQNTSTLAAVRLLADEPAVTRWGQTAIANGLAALESLAGEHAGRYSVGGAPTFADVYLVPQLYNARRFSIDLSPYPKLLEIEHTVSEIPAFVRAHPDRQPDAPTSLSP